jgi:hypothetical protein
MIRIATVLCLLAALGSAGEKITLQFADGKQKAVTLKSFDADSLAFVQADNEHRVGWAELTPESAYAARKALTPYDDGAARLGLAEFARKLRLFPEAQEQLEIALALGGLDEAAFEKRAAALQKEEVWYLTTSIDTLLKAKADPATILAAIKRLKERYPAHEANRKYEPHVKALVEQLAQAAEKEQAAAVKEDEDKELSKLRAAIEKENKKKIRWLAEADDLIKESKEAIAKRQVSRVKRKLVEPSGAERYLKRARQNLRNMAKLDREFRIVTKEGLQKEWDEIEKKLISCYLEVARILMDQRNYKGAVEYVRQLLIYDPINEEALEMVDEIRKNRITFKASDITNARPRVTGG